MKSNVVPISHARSVARRTPARAHLRSVKRVQAASASRPAHAVALMRETPIWVSILALTAMTMWPSALVWMVQLGHRVVVRH
jgi:hypothetical protein